MSNDILLDNLEKLGELYRNNKEYLGQWEKNVLKDENNWWEALKFFLNHSLMKGRRDSLSLDYYYFTCKVIEETYKINEDRGEAYKKIQKDRDNKKFDYKEIVENFKRDEGKKLNSNILLNKEDKTNEQKKSKKNKEELEAKKIINKKFKDSVNGNTLVKELINDKLVENRRKNNHYSLENDKDLCMILKVLEFISDANRKNVYTYLLDLIKEDNIKQAYDEVKKLKEIGDKLSCFILRDILLLNEDISLKEEDYIYAFPIDTWVLKNAKKLGFLESEEISKNLTEMSSKEKDSIKQKLIEKNKNHNHLKFAAGLWLIGIKSLELLVENYLKKEKISNEFILSPTYDD